MYNVPIISMPLTFKDEPCFFDKPKDKPYYKVYNDGSHYVASLCGYSAYKHTVRSNSKSPIDMLFNSLYFEGVKGGLKGYELVESIRLGLLAYKSDFLNLDDYIERKIKSSLHNLHMRKRTFSRKARLNNWNYFVTVTYDDKKHTAESFVKSLRKCLSNLHTRRGYKYIGVFELAPETGRVHFHCLMYIPDGKMLGSIFEKQDFDKHKGVMQTVHINDFFLEKFGRNDFSNFNSAELKNGDAIRYLLKYIGKDNGRVVYSRGVPASVCMQLKDSDIATEFMDFVVKYVLFDDVVDWERDICRAKYVQMPFKDIVYRL